MEAKEYTVDELNELSKETLIKMFLVMQSNFNEVNNNLKLVLEQLKLNNARKYSNSSETASSLNVQLELELCFNEAEALNDNEEKEPEIEKVIVKRKKTKNHKQDFLKKIINHKEIEITLSETELNEKYGEGKWKRLPDEIIHKLEHHRAYFEVIEYHIAVYAKDDNETIIRADRPVELMPGSIVTPSLLSSIIFGKYVNGVPLYRQEKAYENNDVFISRTNMANWVIMSHERYFKYFYDHLKSYLIKEDLIHADETPFLINKDGRNAGSKSYMWVYRTSVSSDKQIVLYDNCHTRGSANPERFLNGYKGTLVCDGFDAYHKLQKNHPDSFKIAGCWAHMRRKYTDIIKADNSATTSSTMIEKIDLIYHEDNKYKDYPDDQRLKYRKEVIKPLVDDYFNYVKKNKTLIPEKSALGKAFTYALNQESYLRAFLDDPKIPLDNNPAERAIRPFTIGRKNWVMIDTIKGADASAAIYSIVETAKANNLKLYDYLNYLLEELPKYINGFNISIPDNLLPWSDDLPDNLRKN